MIAMIRLRSSVPPPVRRSPPSSTWRSHVPALAATPSCGCSRASWALGLPGHALRDRPRRPLQPGAVRGPVGLAGRRARCWRGAHARGRRWRSWRCSARASRRRCSSRCWPCSASTRLALHGAGGLPERPHDRGHELRAGAGDRQPGALASARRGGGGLLTVATVFSILLLGGALPERHRRRLPGRRPAGPAWVPRPCASTCGRAWPGRAGRRGAGRAGPAGGRAPARRRARLRGREHDVRRGRAGDRRRRARAQRKRPGSQSGSAPPAATFTARERMNSRSLSRLR